jgi:predicted ATPase
MGAGRRPQPEMPIMGSLRFARGIAGYYRTGALTWTPLFHMIEAEAEVLCGHAEAALSILDHALQTSRARGENYFEAELMRRRGERFRDRDSSNAETSFREALEIARHQEAKLWELRAASSLARLWVETDRKDEARHMRLATCLRRSMAGGRLFWSKPWFNQ